MPELHLPAAPAWNEELRGLSTVFHVLVWLPTRVALTAALNTYFPQLPLNESQPSDWLDTLGMPVLTWVGGWKPGMRIAWSAAPSTELAQAQLERFSQPDYQGFRRALGIDYHWIFRIRLGFPLVCLSPSDIVDVHIDFDCQGSPECCVLKLT
jgi:hypothetical protein